MRLCVGDVPKGPLVIARARDAGVLRIEHRDDPILPAPLLLHDAQDRVGLDHRGQHEGDAAIAQDRDADRDAGLAARAAREAADLRRARP
jgi:hypothetical protein